MGRVGESQTRSQTRVAAPAKRQCPQLASQNDAAHQDDSKRDWKQEGQPESGTEVELIRRRRGVGTAGKQCAASCWEAVVGGESWEGIDRGRLDGGMTGSE